MTARLSGTIIILIINIIIIGVVIQFIKMIIAHIE